MKPCVYREAIARLAQFGEKNSVIARKLNLSLRTVQRVVKQWKTDGNVDVKKSSGRPHSVNTRRIRSIIKKRIKRNDAVSMNSIAKSLMIARKSVQDIVKKSLDLKSYRLYKGQYLTEAAKKKRLDKCREMLKFLKARRISDILWSDEKIFTLERAHNAKNDRQLLNPSQKNTRKRRFATKSHFPKGVMVWGAISANGKTPLIFIDKSVKINAQVYQDEILKKAVVLWTLNNPNMVFQQDWAPAHGARSTITASKKMVQTLNL